MPNDTPTLHSGLDAVDQAYVKALRDVRDNVVDGRFIAGRRWSQVWTRDSAFALDLGAGLGLPEVAKATLRAKTTTLDGFGEVWTQDRAGHFGGWPHLTDSIVGAVGAWATYLASGDEDFLSWSLKVTRNTLARGEKEALDSDSGLFRGCASFMESNSAYPWRYRLNGSAVGRTKALSTNLLYYRGYELAARMATVAGESPDSFVDRAASLKEAINRRLWDADRGRYAYYEDELGVLSNRMEGLGEALAVLWGVADEEKTRAIFDNVKVTEYGIPCLWPRYLVWRCTFNDANYYHNGMVWPFVQGYWAQAAARHGAPAVFASEFASLTLLSGRACVFYEFYRPGSGRPDGSSRQLWSAAGYLSMVHNGLFGLSFDEKQISFRPVVPESFDRLSLQGFRYRGLTLDLDVSGSGTQVASFAVDGVPQADHYVPIRSTGRRVVTIVMAPE